jgi:shikimate dehydrogenase
VTQPVTGRTRILGVIGHPVQHTFSPAMHGAALAATGLDFAYVAFHVLPADLPAAIAGMRGLQIAGLNVTVPHKPAVLELVDEVTDEASAIGAVNTVANVDNRLIGHNTDAFGVMEALRRDGGVERLPACVALLGAGGAARAALFALLQRQEVEQIILLNRTAAKAEALAADLDQRGIVTVAPLDAQGCALARRAELLVNTTSVGMHPHVDASPLPRPDCLHDGMLVLDTVYNPSRTVLMDQARSAGAHAFNGLGMLAYQGARSFEIWTGRWPPVEVMLTALRDQMRSRVV